jgi:hypothetical protein
MIRTTKNRQYQCAVGLRNWTVERLAIVMPPTVANTPPRGSRRSKIKHAWTRVIATSG